MLFYCSIVDASLKDGYEILYSVDVPGNGCYGDYICYSKTRGERGHLEATTL